MIGIFSAVCAAVGYSENYRIWDPQACIENPYGGVGGLEDTLTNPYGDGCNVAFLSTTLVRSCVRASHLLSLRWCWPLLLLLSPLLPPLLLLLLPPPLLLLLLPPPPLLLLLVL